MPAHIRLRVQPTVEGNLTIGQEGSQIACSVKTGSLPRRRDELQELLVRKMRLSPVTTCNTGALDAQFSDRPFGYRTSIGTKDPDLYARYRLPDGRKGGRVARRRDATGRRDNRTF